MAPSSAGPGNKPRQQHDHRVRSYPIGGHSSSTERWNDVAHGTMDEVSSHVRLDLPLSDGKADPKIVPPRPRIPWWKGPGADSEEKREPVSDIDTAVVDSLKVLDPNRPTREATIQRTCWNPITCRSLSAAPTPGMLNRLSLWMRLQEMVKHMQ